MRAAKHGQDFVGAYKTLPLKGSNLQFAVTTWGAAARKGWALQLLSCPFGGIGERPLCAVRPVRAPRSRG